VKQAREHVAPELVGAQEMTLGEGPRELVGHLDLERIAHGDRAGEGRREHEEGDHRRADHGGPVADEARPEDAGESFRRGGLRGSRGGHDGRAHEWRTRGSMTA
jgi:hypothetical protein